MTWGPLAKSAKVAFEWNSSTIALMTNSGVLAVLLNSFLCSWMMELKGGLYEYTKTTKYKNKNFLVKSRMNFNLP